MQPGSSATKTSSPVTIYGFKLGAAYKDALSAASQLNLKEDAPELHRGTGTIDGMQASLSLAGKNGQLVDIQLQLTPDKADQSLDGSKPFTRLQADLGAPADKSADVASWRPPGFEITLQRQATWARGEDNPRIEYTLRGRVTSPQRSTAPDPGEQEAKEREAEQGAP